MNNEKMEMNQQQNTQTGMQAPPVAQPTGGMYASPYYGRDPRSLGQYTVDRAFDSAGRELQRMENEKPGTRRKIAGGIALGVSVASGVTGIVLLAL